MRFIERYGPIPPGQRVVLQMPSGARPVHVAAHLPARMTGVVEIYVYADVETNNPAVPTTFVLAETGWRLDEFAAEMDYIGTVGANVDLWHLFAVRA